MKAYRVPVWRRLTRPILRSIFRLIFHLLARVRITGRQNIPRGQPYVVAMNHVSLFDPPFMLTFFPKHLEVMSAIDVWERPGQNILIRLYGAVPVHRGEYDRRLLESVLSILRSGHPLLIAPEGGRSHDTGMRRAKPGIAYIVEQAQVVVLPVGIVGTTDDFWKRASRGDRPQLELRIGEPFMLPRLGGKGKDRHQARQRNADLVMKRIASLLPKAYRGFYAQWVNASAETGQRDLAS